MPRFFFDVHDGADYIDPEGTELADLAAVREQAVLASAEAIRELGDRFWKSHEWRLVVRDEVGREVLRLRFSAF